jgi:hypothetical protein
MQRPTLDKNISVSDFKSFYWLKEELTDFCRQHGITSSGGKIDIANRIIEFLSTRKVINSSPKIHRSTQKLNLLEITLDSPITKKYTSNETNRAFFKSVIGPHFHFTTRFMNFCKANPDKTYADAVKEWHAEQEEKKDPNFKTEIAPQFEYNRFMREYKSKNPGKSFQNAVQAWKDHRSKPKA